MTETTSVAAARVQHLDVPVTAPGCCACCGKSKHPEGFATADNLDFEFFGRFYLCGDCVGDFARIFGWEHPARVEAVLEGYRDALRRIDLLNDEIESLRAVTDAIDRYNTVHSLLDDGNVTRVLKQEIVRTESVSKPESADIIDEPDGEPEAEPTTSEPPTEQRPNDVPSTTGDDNFLAGLDL